MVLYKAASINIFLKWFIFSSTYFGGLDAHLLLLKHTLICVIQIHLWNPDTAGSPVTSTISVAYLKTIWWPTCTAIMYCCKLMHNQRKLFIFIANFNCRNVPGVHRSLYNSAIIEGHYYWHQNNRVHPACFQFIFWSLLLGKMRSDEIELR